MLFHAWSFIYKRKKHKMRFFMIKFCKNIETLENKDLILRNDIRDIFERKRIRVI